MKEYVERHEQGYWWVIYKDYEPQPAYWNGDYLSPCSADIVWDTDPEFHKWSFLYRIEYKIGGE